MFFIMNQLSQSSSEKSASATSTTLPVSDATLDRLTQRAAEAVSQLVADTIAALEQDQVHRTGSQRSSIANNNSDLKTHHEMTALRQRVEQLEAEKTSLAQAYAAAQLKLSAFRHVTGSVYVNTAEMPSDVTPVLAYAS
jgi:hypothetical protein